MQNSLAGEKRRRQLNKKKISKWFEHVSAFGLKKIWTERIQMRAQNMIFICKLLIWLFARLDSPTSMRLGFCAWRAEKDKKINIGFDQKTIFLF